MIRAVLTKRDAESKMTRGTGGYVCLDEAYGGLKAGVYHVDFCLVVGDHAFFSRSTPARKLIVVPRSVVFETRDEAHTYAASKGHLRWCVSEEGEEIEVFQAHVREDLRENLYGSYRRLRVVMRKGKRESETRTYGLETFATEREANKRALERITKKLAASKQSLAEYTKEIRTLQAAEAQLRKK